MRDPDLSAVRANKLQNRGNYLALRRTLDRTAKSMNIWGIMTGDEKIIKLEPTEADNYLYAHEGPVTRTAAANGADQDAKIDGTRTLFEYQAAYKRWELNKAKVRLARQLLDEAVRDVIAVEIEDTHNSCKAANYIKTNYGVNDDTARRQILSLLISPCKNAT